VSTTTTVEIQEAVRRDPAAAREIALKWRQQLSDPVLRLHEMDELGIDIMGVTTSPFYYLYWAEPEIGVPFARVQNEALAKYCSTDPRRLFFMATLPLQDIAASVEEAEHAVGTLHARAVNIGGGNLAGRELDDPELEPVLACIEALGVPLFIHPYPTTLAGGERHRLGMDAILEYLYQESLAVGTLIYGGVLDKFPGLKVCITHGGGFVPYQFGRLEVFAGPKASKAVRPIRDYLDRFYFDTLVHDLPARRFLYEFMGPDHLFVGDNFKGADSADGFAMVDELNLHPEEAEQIKSGTAIELFGLQDLVA
jgi:aminocarboxymuconate-semialdehyde decarboxylase